MWDGKLILWYGAAAVALGIWALSLAGGFQTMNGTLYDFCLRHSDWVKRPRSQVLAVRVPYEQAQQEDVWISLLNILNNLGAKQTIFLFFPENASRDFYARTSTASNVFFGRETVSSRWKSRDPLLAPLPSQAAGLDLQIGLNSIPSAASGIYRFQYAWQTVAGKTWRNVLVMAAAERMGSQGKHVPTDKLFAVNFGGRPAGLPNVDLEDILEGNIVQDMVIGRSVLVGVDCPLRVPAYQTPLGPEVGPMSPLMFSGYALDTLLDQAIIEWADPWVTLGALVLVVLVGMFGYQAIRATTAALFCPALPALSFGVSWGVLVLFRYWLPLGEIVCAQLLLLVVVVLIQSRTREQLARQIILDRSVRIRDLFRRETTVESAQFWSQIITMVNQTLNLKKAIFLEKVPGQARVREVTAIHTSLADIQERRRDYTRTPYTLALDEGGPVQVARFFNTCEDDENEYLVPLSFAGEVLGFWAFTVLDERTQIEALLPSVRKFASEIAEILYRKRKADETRPSGRTRLTRRLGVRGSEEPHYAINQLLALLERRLSFLQSVIDSQGSASVVYDLFGRVLSINRQASELLAGLDLPPYEMTALDLAVRLSRREPDDIRALLTRVITLNEVITLPANVKGESLERSFLIVIRPVTSNSEQQKDGHPQPFNMSGILFEMTEVTDTVDLTRIKDRIIERGSSHLIEGIGTLTETTALLRFPGIPESERNNILDLIHQRSLALEASSRELKTYLGKDVFSGLVEFVPVSAVEPVERARDELPGKARERRIGIAIEDESEGSLVLAMPQDLKEVVVAVLTVLVNDAYDDSDIRVRIVPRGPHIEYSLSDEGYGMPDHEFQRFLATPELIDSRDYRQLQEKLRKLDVWQGEWHAFSQVGEGIRFTLRLVKSLISP